MVKEIKTLLIVILLVLISGCSENSTDEDKDTITTDSSVTIPILSQAPTLEPTLEPTMVPTQEPTKELIDEDSHGDTTAPAGKGNITTANNINTQLTIVDIPDADPNLSDKYNRDYWPTNEWRTSSPEDQGIDSAIFDKTNNDILENKKKIRSLLVIKNGYIIYEKYYQKNYNVNSRDEIASATKSVSSALIGIAIREGYIDNIDNTVTSILPEVISEESAKEASTVTIRNILEMSSGFDWSDSRDEYSAMTSGDPLKYLFAKPLSEVPGAVFNYNTLGSHTLSGIIQKTTGLNTAAFANAYLLNPLGIKNWDWVEVYGLPLGGHSLYITTRDFAKFGYLYLNEGMWDGKQVVPSEWVKASLTPYHDALSSYGYGYQFWIETKREPYAFFAWGAGGQYCYVVPELDLIIATTSNDYLNPNSSILRQQVILPLVDDIYNN